MSDRGVRDYSLEAKLRDLEAVVGALKLNRFAVYAWGAGGPVAIAYAVRHPERITRIAFNGAYAKSNVSVLKGEARERQEPVYSLMEKRWDDPAFREMWASLMMPDGSAVDRTFFTRLQRDSATLEDFVAFLKADDQIDTTALLYRKLGLRRSSCICEATRSSPWNMAERLRHSSPGHVS